MNDFGCKMVGMLDIKGRESIRRVYSPNGLSPTLTTCGGGNREVKISEPVIGAVRGRNPENPSDRTAGIPTEQRLEIGGDVSNTLTTVQKDNVVVEPNIRVRKLTPLEYWRLMGFSDVDFLAAKVGSVDVGKEILAKYPHEEKRRMSEAERLSKMSNSQLYKQAGNSIVVDVLMAIFKEML